MTEFVEREVDIYVLPLSNVTLLHPERCVLQFGKGGTTIDVGATCYRQTLRATEGAQHRGNGMDSSSPNRHQSAKLEFPPTSQ